MRAVKAGVLGGIILFVWSCISWMVLPWHYTTIHSFNNEAAITQAIQTNTLASGMYMLPMMKPDGTAAKEETATPTPTVFAAVKLDGMQKSMTIPMIRSFIMQVIAATLVAWLLLKTAGLGYIRRVGFVAVFAIVVSILANFCYWNWFGFDMQYTLVEMADMFIAWFLAGLGIAAVCKS